jgi:predicted AAA+ superfamily ATPase
VEEALQDTRVVAVLGARQVGKSTLVKTIADEYLGARVVTFDDQVTRAAAQDDPTGFAMGLDLPVVIDEVQRVPDVLLAIKQRVDQDPSPGQFLLTGSANILTAPRSTPDVFEAVVHLTGAEAWRSRSSPLERLLPSRSAPHRVKPRPRPRSYLT